jgi:hypothetical protein
VHPLNIFKRPVNNSGMVPRIVVPGLGRTPVNIFTEENVNRAIEMANQTSHGVFPMTIPHLHRRTVSDADADGQYIEEESEFYVLYRQMNQVRLYEPLVCRDAVLSFYSFPF